jgi:hypothetical protein
VLRPDERVGRAIVTGAEEDVSPFRNGTATGIGACEWGLYAIVFCLGVTLSRRPRQQHEERVCF